MAGYAEQRAGKTMSARPDPDTRPGGGVGGGGSDCGSRPHPGTLPRLRDFFAWVRIPTVFSSMGNAYAGWWLGGHAQVTHLWLGMLASALFLMAGMGLNDIADLEVDRQERPKRPLPSGAIRLGQAWTLALGMMALGLVLQACANVRAAAVGVVLVAAIFLYNFALKGTWLGPISMGLCRALNVLAGLSLNWTEWPYRALSEGSFFARLEIPFTWRLALISLGAYIALVTYLARDEVQGNARARVRTFLFFFGLWLGAWVALAWRGLGPWWGLVGTMAALMSVIGPPFKHLWRRPTPAHSGKMIGALLRSIPLVDMLALWTAGLYWPIVISMAVFMVPGPILMKRFYST